MRKPLSICVSTPSSYNLALMFSRSFRDPYDKFLSYPLIETRDINYYALVAPFADSLFLVLGN